MRLVKLVTMMRFNALFGMLLLTGSAFAGSVGEVFETNRADILSRSVTIIDESVFTVGKAKSSEKAGTSIGFSKASAFAYGNLDRLNYDRAEWPSDITADEKGIVWKLYRTEHPFALKVEGGSRVCEEKTAPENYLVVMSFPKAQVLLPPVKMPVLQNLLTKVRAEVAAVVAEHQQNKVEESVQTNSSSVIQGPVQATPTIQKMETLDEGLML